MPTVTYTVFEGEILSEDRGGTERDYVSDPLGSTVALLDSSQAQTDTFSYWPYGEEKSRTGTTSTPFRYVGREGYYLDESDEYYVRFREYQARKGRWTSKDPVTFEGRDDYRYCRGNPVRWTDMYGLLPEAGDVAPVDQVAVGINIAVAVLCASLTLAQECLVPKPFRWIARFSCGPCKTGPNTGKPDTTDNSNFGKCRRACRRRRGKGGMRCVMLACVEGSFNVGGIPIVSGKDCLCVCPTGRTGPLQEWHPPDW